MTVDLRALWSELRSEAGLGSSLVRRRLSPDAHVGIYACVAGQRHSVGLLVEAPGRAGILDDRAPRCRGVRVHFDERHSPDRTSITVLLEDDRLAEIFAVLCLDLVSVTLKATSDDQALRECVDRLCMWQGLFDRLSPQGLSPERQRGLLGELVTLDQMFIAGLGQLPGVQAWLGATNAAQDFLHQGIALEVKTSLAKRHAKISISNERQLDESPHIKLILQVHKLTEHAVQGLTLPEQVAAVRAGLSDPVAARLFEERLLLADYLDAQAKLYTGRYLFSPAEHYVVEGDFPRLTEANLPAGVGDIRYSIIPADFAGHLIGAAEVGALLAGGNV